VRIPAMWIEYSDDLNKPSKLATLAFVIMPEGYSHRQGEAVGFPDFGDESAWKL
jgi:hypothetical protein